MDNKSGVFYRVEAWKEVDGFPEYEVSDHGAVRRKKSQRLLQPFVKSGSRHLIVMLRKYGRYHPHPVYRLVLNAFRGPRAGPTQWARHRDGDPLNNDVDNLDWVGYLAILQQRKVTT